MFISNEVLKGSSIQLEQLNATHKEELFLAAQDEAIWVYNSSSAFGDRFYKWFHKAMKCCELHQHLPFVVRRLSDHKVIGSTRFYDINMDHKKLSLGYTWYIPEVWGSSVNPECKLLLLTYVFEEVKLNRVEFMIDSRNTRSRAAIKKLGAIEEGILRQHMILDDGFVRDSVVFSIIKQDWPSVKKNLQFRIKKI